MSTTASEQLRDEGTRPQVVLAGAISGLISRFCIAPLDVVKIRLQLHYHSLADPLSRPVRAHTPTGVAIVVRDIWRHEGLTGFWKGNIPAEGLYLSYGAMQFLAYRSTTQALNELAEHGNVALPGTGVSFISGAVAGTAATTTTYPLDLLRTRFAAQGTEKVYDGLIGSVREIVRYEGYAGFFKGLNAGIGQVIPYMGLFFSLYEGLKPPLTAVSLPFGSGDALAGVTASILSKSAVFPLDTVRKRLQVQGPSRSRYVGGRVPVYDRGVISTIKMIMRKEGMIGLYRGLTVSLVKAAPSSAVTMWAYERALHLIMDLEQSREA